MVAIFSTWKAPQIVIEMNWHRWKTYYVALTCRIHSLLREERGGARNLPVCSHGEITSHPAAPFPGHSCGTWAVFEIVPYSLTHYSHFRKCSHHRFFYIYSTGSVLQWHNVKEFFSDMTLTWYRPCKYCQLWLVLNVARLVQCDTKIFAFLKIGVQLRFNSRVNVRYSAFNSVAGQLDVWHH